MNKVCPQCHKPPIEDDLLLCHTCKVPFVERTDAALHLTKSDLDQIAKSMVNSWKFWIRFAIAFIVALLLVGVPAVTMIGVSLANKSLKASLDSFNQQASNRVASAYSAVTNQIEEEFQTPRIKRTIESVAKGEAKTILEAEVQPVVTNFRSEVDKKLYAITTEQDFLAVANRARAHDYRAYLHLHELAGQTNDFSKLAAQVAREIDRALEFENASVAHLSLMEGGPGGTYSGPFTSDELAEKLQAARTDPAREGIINGIRDLKQPLFLGMLISQLTNETDLAVANRITLAASDVSREKFHPRDLRRIQTWWQNHLNEYTNWPISDFQMGMQDFMSVNYVGAGEAFGRVLNLDQDADRVRAWLIVCNWEAGDTNKALVLAKSFKNADSRWQKFAAAKAELASGNVSNATSQLVSLLTNYPTMSGTFLGEGSHLWRNVDWPLFHRLNGDVPGVPGAIPLIVIDNTPLKMALSHLAKQAGLDVVIDEAISGNVSTRWENLTAKQAFDCLCETNHLIAFKDSATGVIQIRPKQ